MNLLPELLESRLLAACTDSSEGFGSCTSAAVEHLAAGGGRVRAHICLDAARRLGLSDNDAVCSAAVCELLHNASLIQDDLLDRTAVRRGRPSVWVRFGDTAAVCTGDLMLSAAYSLLAELSVPAWIAPALRLVHRRTSDVIVGQAAEASQRKPDTEGTLARYERLAKAKSASLLSLALELPLLLAGHENALAIAHEAASDFAVAYQIADDFADFMQDRQEGSSNLLLLLMDQDGFAKNDAYESASKVANARLVSAEKLAGQLLENCAATLLLQTEKLRKALAEHAVTTLATAGA